MTSRIKFITTLMIITLSVAISGCTAPVTDTTAPDTSGSTTASGSSSSDTTAPNTTSSDTTAPDTTAPGNTTPQTSPTTNGGQTVNYQILTQAPQHLKSSIEALKKDKGYFLFHEDKVLVIFMGERSTGGYALSLDGIEALDEMLAITVTEKSPGPNDIVTQAFTYPMLILQLEEDFSKVHIKNQLGEVYPINQSNLY